MARSNNNMLVLILTVAGIIIISSIVGIIILIAAVGIGALSFFISKKKSRNKYKDIIEIKKTVDNTGNDVDLQEEVPQNQSLLVYDDWRQDLLDFTKTVNDISLMKNRYSVLATTGALEE